MSKSNVSIAKKEESETDPIPKLTPSPRKRCKLTVPKDEEDHDGYMTPSPSKRGCSASPSKRAKGATSLDDASESDRLLWQLKEEGKGWGDIQKAIEQFTGEVLKKNALSMRYTRMKRNFAVIKDADISHLIEAKKTVDSQMDKERWTKIAAEVAARGGDSYDGAVLQKKIKQLEKDGLIGNFC